MLRQHEIGKYHGYIVENFKTLDESVKNVLYRTGFIQNITKGKIK